jgi:hypothetical protein
MQEPCIGNLVLLEVSRGRMVYPEVGFPPTLLRGRALLLAPSPCTNRT